MVLFYTARAYLRRLAHTLKLDKRRGDCATTIVHRGLALMRVKEKETFFTLVREKVVKKYKPAKRREINGLPPLLHPAVIHIEKLGNNEPACYRDRATWPRDLEAKWNVHGPVL